MTKVERDAAHVAAVAAKLAGPPTVWVVRVDNGDSSRDIGIYLYGSYKKCLKAIAAMIEEDFDTDSIDREERKKLLADLKADGECGTEGGTWYTTEEREIEH